MSLKEPMKKQNQGNWTNLPKNAKKQFNFNRNHQNISYKTMNYIDPQYNNAKLIQKKRPPHLLHDSRSASTIIFFPNGKVKNSLAFYPLDVRMGPMNKTNKHIDNYRLHNKSAIDIIKVPKTNTNKNSITHNILKMNTNKNKDAKNINYVISAYNLPSKNTYFGDFMKKIINNKPSNNNTGALSNSMTLINKNTPNISNMPGLETINNINVGINKNEMLEKAQKEKERLNQILNEKIKNSQKINERIKDLENKNKSLVQKINKVQKKNDNLSSTLDKIIKLMKLLKSNGFDIPEILNNLSDYEEEDYDKNKKEEKEEKEESENTGKDFSFKLNDQFKEDSNIFDNININENDKDKDSNKINIKKIANMNKKNSKLKEREEFSFRNNKKINSHSVGDDKD